MNETLSSELSPPLITIPNAMYSYQKDAQKNDRDELKDFVPNCLTRTLPSRRCAFASYLSTCRLGRPDSWPRTLSTTKIANSCNHRREDLFASGTGEVSEVSIYSQCKDGDPILNVLKEGRFLAKGQASSEGFAPNLPFNHS